MSMLLALRFSPAATLAFVMGAGFIADTASLPLVVSNLVNIVSADFFGIGFNRYAAVMLPVNLVSVLATLGVLLWYFRRDLPADYDPLQLDRPRSAIVDPATFVAGWAVLLILLVGCFALEPLGIPVSAISTVCAAVLLAVAARGHRISTRKVLKEAPWHIVIFSLGMYLVVYGLRNAGLTAYLAGWLDAYRLRWKRRRLLGRAYARRHDLTPRIDRTAAIGKGDAVALVTHHGDDVRGVEGASRRENVPDERNARERVQHLGRLRLHARALAGGEDDGGPP